MRKITDVLAVSLGTIPTVTSELKIIDGTEPIPLSLLPKSNIPSDKQKCQPKEQHEFTVKGVKIMAASRKDAIKKYNHLKGK